MMALKYRWRRRGTGRESPGYFPSPTFFHYKGCACSRILEEKNCPQPRAWASLGSDWWEEVGGLEGACTRTLRTTKLGLSAS